MRVHVHEQPQLAQWRIDAWNGTEPSPLATAYRPSRRSARRLGSRWMRRGEAALRSEMARASFWLESEPEAACICSNWWDRGTYGGVLADCPRHGDPDVLRAHESAATTTLWRRLGEWVTRRSNCGRSSRRL